MKKYGMVVFMAVVIVTLTLMSSMVMADCDDYALDTIPGWNNEFRWVGQSWSWYHCVWEDNHYSQKLPYVVAGTGSCTPDSILQQRADGCSGGCDDDRRRFRAACNEHDKCYATPGVSKETCDNNFRGNMYYICDHHYFGSCKINADAFYSAVAVFGGPSYNNGQEWGRNHCLLHSVLPGQSANAAPAEGMIPNTLNDLVATRADTLEFTGSIKENMAIAPRLYIPVEMQAKIGNLYAVVYWVEENILFQVTPAGIKQISDGIESLGTETLAESVKFNILESEVNLSDLSGTFDIYVGCATKDDLSDLVYNYYRVIFQ